MAIHNETTLKQIYNCEVAANLLRKYVVTQDVNAQTGLWSQIYTLVSNATAINAALITASPNFSNLP